MGSRIGYACINMSLGSNGRFRTTTVKHASQLLNRDMLAKIKELSLHNLSNTLGIIMWNIRHNIRMYRLTSSVIPLGSHTFSDAWDWASDPDVIALCEQIRTLVIQYDLRLSFHPDHYTVINSLDDTIVASSIKHLVYHNKMCNLIGSNTLVMHVGGVYSNKPLARERFITAFNSLSKDIQSKIVLENDDRSYTVEDTLSICKQLDIPMCLDFHHDRCNVSKEGLEYYVKDIISTWKGKTPKLHLSTGKDFVTDRSHAGYILQEDFNSTRSIYPEADVMLECKSKELAIFKISLHG